jgi:hypothetical protein
VASDLTNGGLSRQFGVNNGPVVSTITPASGAVFQPSATADTIVYLQVTGGAGGGNLSVTMGPSTGAENAIVTTMAVAASNGEEVTLKVPASWRVVWTGTGNVARSLCVVVTD